MIRSILHDIAGLNPVEEALSLGAIGAFIIAVAYWADLIGSRVQ
jgi:hypothetical protein